MNIYSKTNPPEGFYVYAYIRSKDSETAKAGTPYYIGKGKAKRAIEGHTVRTPKDYERIIILEQNLTEVGAFAIERRLIRWWGRKDIHTGILRNKTDGGEGTSGWKMPTETRNKIGDANRGNVFSDKSKKNISNGKKGKKRTPEHSANISKALTGKTYKPRTTPSKPHKPRTKPNKNKGVPGTRHSDSAIANIKLARIEFLKNEEQVTCPHCGRAGGKSSLKNYHFDNCKNKPETKC